MQKSGLPCLVLVASLSACAVNVAPVAKAPAPVPMATTINEADIAAKAGQGDKAIRLLKDAAGAYPTDKAPWLRMAQLRFDQGDYGQAVLDATEALQRDGDDTLGLSILAVSGLRVSSKALGELSQKNNISGSVRTEAESLAKLMRAALGEDVLVPHAGGGPGASKTIKQPVKKPLPTKPTAAADPFSGLK